MHTQLVLDAKIVRVNVYYIYYFFLQMTFVIKVVVSNGYTQEFYKMLDLFTSTCVNKKLDKSNLVLYYLSGQIKVSLRTYVKILINEHV